MKYLILLFIVSCGQKSNTEMVSQRQIEAAKQRAVIANTLKHSRLKFKGKRDVSSISLELDYNKDLDTNIRKRKQFLRALKE
ncbi:MAG: hypothetical protein ACO20H_02360 [Bacteriovoracaceae bacterium]